MPAPRGLAPRAQDRFCTPAPERERQGRCSLLAVALHHRACPLSYALQACVSPPMPMQGTAARAVDALAATLISKMREKFGVRRASVQWILLAPRSDVA